jgi:hypothetical protein
VNCPDCGERIENGYFPTYEGVRLRKESLCIFCALKVNGDAHEAAQKAAREAARLSRARALSHRVLKREAE